MTQPPLVIWGASGHALVVADIIRLQGHYRIVGFLDDVNLERHHIKFCGATILGGTEQLDKLKQEGVNNLIFGFGDCEARLRLAHLVLEKGFNLISAIHPKSVIAGGVVIGEGTVVTAGAVINPGVRIGRNVIVNTCASVDHESIIDDGAHICPGVHIGGRAWVGQGVMIGIGTSVKDHVHIGKHTVIGAGSVVLHHVPEGVVAYGVPARVIRNRGESSE